LTIKSTSHTNTFLTTSTRLYLPPVLTRDSGSARFPLLADATFYALIYLCL
jgi:hypothetical protein